ncbi:hypothetical protein [Burkholderia multivorans]|uniref:hypothetical protein n=1 Tax=Burkholderia multivorans TaxID=87883 RepID=UPI00158A45EF|nr:hypothetical protein [Burkholderia multivorans]
MKAKNPISFALLVASFILHANATYAEASPTGDVSHTTSATPAGFFFAKWRLDDLRGRLCPSGESPQSMTAGDAESWSCGPWTALSAPEADAAGRVAGWVVSYSRVVQPGKADSIADAEKQCRNANATVTSQSAASVECRAVSDGTEQIVTYTVSSDLKPHALFGQVLFTTRQDRMTYTVTVRPLSQKG